MSKLLIHNRLESDTSVTQSIIGTNGTIEGTLSYTAMKHGNGAGSTSSSNRIKFAAYDSSLTNSWRRGCVEFWMQADVTAGTDRMPFCVYKDTKKKVQIDMYSNVMQFIFWNDSEGVVGTPMSFIPGTGLCHVGVCWDSSGIAGSADKVRCYLNGTLSGSNTDDFSTGLSGNNDITIISGRNDATNYFHMNGYMDNIKLWDYAKTDFSDRNNERAGLNDQIIIV